jgi:5,10-methylenetetrahydrofolate reductase
MRALRSWAVRHAGLVEAAYGAFSACMETVAPVARLVPRRLLERTVRPVEKAAKGLMFDCRMCGQCLLSRSGMACPMNCPKGLRNGPCGGIRRDGTCELDASMPCVWLEAWNGAARMKDQASIRAIQHPVSHRQSGRSTWTAQIYNDDMDRSWAGMSAPAPDLFAAGAAPLSTLHQRLAAGDFVVTSEFNPPDSSDPEAIADKVTVLAEACDAVNVTDGPGAHAHISSIATCAILTARGVEAVMQISCRDRNRIAIQADALGAAALGLRNVLCMSGDGVANGDHPDAKPVFDFDAAALLRTLRLMRDEGRFLSGKRLAAAPPLFLGATANPSGPSTGIEIRRLAKKVEAGASFIQTQFCYDMARLEAFMSAFRAEGLHERCKLLLGVGPLNSPRAAEWMRLHVPGVRIPDAVIARMAAAPDPKAEGRAICVETIRHIRTVPGVAGVHVMAMGNPAAVGEICDAAGVGPRHRAQRAPAPIQARPEPGDGAAGGA